MTDQSLQDIINALPEKLRLEIMQETEVKNLLQLKHRFRKDKDVVTVIDARIENLTYLAT